MFCLDHYLSSELSIQVSGDFLWLIFKAEALSFAVLTALTKIGWEL